VGDIKMFDVYVKRLCVKIELDFVNLIVFMMVCGLGYKLDV